MGVPTLENGPWTFNVNNDCSEGTIGDTKRHSLWQLKECLKGFSAWSVVASSDSVSVKNIGDASPDLWSDWLTDIVGNSAGSAHSWIILENSTNGEQICFDVAYTDLDLNVVYSATGAFNTDGSITNRPTDTESQAMGTNFDWDGGGSDGAVVHAMISNDNKCTRWYIHFRDESSVGGWFGCVEEILNPNSKWTSTHKRCVIRNTNPVGLSTTNTQKSPKASTYSGSTQSWACFLEDATPYSGWNTMFPTCECYHNYFNDTGQPKFANNTIQDWLDGYPISQIGLYRSEKERGGGIGRLQDIFFAHEYHDTYDTYDSVGSREWIKFGCFLVPWNGTQPLEVP